MSTTTAVNTSLISQWVKTVLAFSSEYAGWPSSNVVGPSNTYPNYGDLKTAWAPSKSTGTKEFLELQFEKKVLITGIEIYETYNPGAVVKVSAKKPDNTWEELYTGPMQQKLLPQQSRVFSPILKQGFVSDSIRLDMDCVDSASYSEIDAVNLLGVDPSLAGQSFSIQSGDVKLASAAFGEAFHQHVTELHKCSKFSDVTLNHNGNNYKGHRLILCKAETLKNLFDANPAEKYFTLSIEDPKNVFQTVYEFMYKGEILITPETMIAIKNVAAALKLNEAIVMVEKFLNNNMNNNVCFDFLKTGLEQDKNYEDVLVKKSVEYIAKNVISLLDKLQDNVSWIPLPVFCNIISQDSFSLSDDVSQNKFQNIVKSSIESHKVLTNPAYIKTLLKALAKSKILKSATAVSMMKAVAELNKQGVTTDADVLADCYPAIAAEFDYIYNNQSAALKKDELLGINAAAMAQILSADELLCSTEDEVYDFVIQYIAHNKDTMNDAEKIAVLHTVRLVFMSLPKFQSVVKDMNDPKGNPCLKLVQPDIMQALVLRVNRSEQQTTGTETNKNLIPRSKRMFIHQSDFDTNGILYWIGCNFGQNAGKYENPVAKGYIAINTTNTFEAGKAEFLVSHTPCSCNFNASANTNFTIDFKKALIMPTKYTLRHTDARDSECLRNWKLEGSKDGVTWVLLSEHKDDQKLNGKSSTGSWDINDKTKEFYKFIKLEQTGNNSSNSTYMNLAGMEFYGSVKLLP